MLDGSSLSALVVGGGRVAARKVRALLDAGARVHVVAPEISAEIREWATTNPNLALSHVVYSSEQLSGALLIVAASAAGKLVNDVSNPDLGNCSTPAVHRAGDVVVAVSTGSVPPAAARIRDAIAIMIDARYDGVIKELSLLRRSLLDAGRRERWHEAAAAIVGRDFCDDVAAGRLERRLAEWR
jgi:precorrin-2 dehydrogenase / sirohydrochlorin ferrochelatase